ncbi:hypothetical protein BD413DRAFT_668818 [Trametes elegans]|nr:hypothetical protein BD413DRAFT_668818 [Trametes elegans]
MTGMHNHVECVFVFRRISARPTTELISQLSTVLNIVAMFSEPASKIRTCASNVLSTATEVRTERFGEQYGVQPMSQTQLLDLTTMEITCQSTRTVEQPVPPTMYISRLPAELLSMTFMFLAEQHPHRWTRAMLVCRIWRDVALNTIALWQHITITRQTVEWLKLALARSLRAPVNIMFELEEPQPWSNESVIRKVVPLLTRAAVRLRALKFLNYPSNDELNVLYDALFADVRMPLLRELVVICNEGGGHLGQFADVQQVPSLRVLQCEGTWFPWTSPVLRQLRVLKLAYTVGQDEIRLEDFVAMLQDCHRLEELDLWDAASISYPQDEAPLAPFAPVNRVASLPRLRSFKLWYHYFWYEFSPSKCYQILACIQFPASVAIEIVLEVFPSHDPHFSYDIAIPRDTFCLPILRTAKSARLRGGKYYGEWMGIECSQGDGSAGVLHVDFKRYGPNDSKRRSSHPWSYTLSAQFRDFSALFAQSPLTTLSLVTLNLKDAPLVELFHAFPDLADVEYRARGTQSEEWQSVTALLGALACSPSVSAVGAANVVLPALLSGVASCWRLVHVLLACVVLRAKHDTRLSELHISAYGCHTKNAKEVAEHGHLMAALDAMVDGHVVYLDGADAE